MRSCPDTDIDPYLLYKTGISLLSLIFPVNVGSHYINYLFAPLHIASFFSGFSGQYRHKQH